jgi:1,4-alpha-glucan branching enzyme
VSRSRPKGELAIVLHTHMPYVEGFGSWPFGEEWLWEAIAACYLPLLDLLDGGAPLTLSLTPVLCDQLEAPGVGERFVRFVDEVRRYTHAEDARGLRAGGHEQLARELERSWAEYEWALERFRAREGDLLAAFASHVQWTSSATHAVLPLLATDAGVRAQVQTGIDSHCARFGTQGGGHAGQGWAGGFWLPECAHAPHLEPLLAGAGVRATCVELAGRFGLRSSGHLRPLKTESGVVLVPIDRATIDLVWSEQGYPAHGAYRDYHRHTIHHHQPWANDGGAYDHEHAVILARAHARDFVEKVIERLRCANEREQESVLPAPPGTAGRRASAALPEDALPGGGLAVCALDTELLGHWWYEGTHWLRAVVEECSRQGLALVRLDEAAALRDPDPVDGPLWDASSWGKDGDLSTWSGPRVANMAFEQRAAELRVLGARERAGAAALRELLALQASDWPFMVSRGLAVPYALQRFAAHRDALQGALMSGSNAGADGLRNLAAHANPAIVLGP